MLLLPSGQRLTAAEEGTGLSQWLYEGRAGQGFHRYYSHPQRGPLYLVEAGEQNKVITVLQKFLTPMLQHTD